MREKRAGVEAALDHGFRRFPLARLGEALDATRDRPDGFLKALVAP